jgi:hypothetical protein
MSKKYMPKDVFEVGVSSIAKLHLTSGGKSLEELADLIWENYSRDLLDDGVTNDMISAASQAITWLEENNAPSINELFHHFQYFCINYDDEGNPKTKKIFNGILFDKSVKDSRRVEKYLRKIQVYYIGAKAGVMPLAPSGWSLGNR